MMPSSMADRMMLRARMSAFDAPAPAADLRTAVVRASASVCRRLRIARSPHTGKSSRLQSRR
jgi:hypothetical protein